MDGDGNLIQRFILHPYYYMNHRLFVRWRKVGGDQKEFCVHAGLMPWNIMES